MAIVVTGAAGFIGSCLVSFLNQKGQTNLILVDDFQNEEKVKRLEEYNYALLVDRKDFLQDMNFSQFDFVFHIGARTDTTETNTEIFDELNLEYSKAIWQRCTEAHIPLLYASSAATYGDGSHGFDDRSDISVLKPLNAYGQSKQDFDLWIEEQEDSPPFWCGLKFFNVFGPNESHKGRMASVVFHAYNQIREKGSLKLFRSHHPDFRDGEQKRDFIYVKDLLNLMWFWYNNRRDSGLYNAGTGFASTFLDLANAIFKALDLKPSIEFIDTPEDIRDKYQYYTCADMDLTRSMGFERDFTPLDDAVNDYISNYLIPGNRF